MNSGLKRSHGGRLCKKICHGFTDPCAQTLNDGWDSNYSNFWRLGLQIVKQFAIPTANNSKFNNATSNKQEDNKYQVFSL
jgi:hypothetical protein